MTLDAVRSLPRVRRLLAIAVVLAAVLVPATASAAPPRTITLVNYTDQTIWPAASPGSTSGQTGWTLEPGAEVSFQVPHDWNARLWGRTGCHFGAGAGDCRTGDCDGRYQCGGWGTIPATLGEFNFDAYKGLDFYDISMVDGSNLPMSATPSGGEADRKGYCDYWITFGVTPPDHGAASAREGVLTLSSLKLALDRLRTSE